jgi:hypothetical protein
LSRSQGSPRAVSPSEEEDEEEEEDDDDDDDDDVFTEMIMKYAFFCEKALLKSS